MTSSPFRRQVVCGLFVAALATAVMAPIAFAQTFVSGFNGDLASSIGAGGAWEVPADSGMPAPEFVPSLSEGTLAVQVANDPIEGSWPALLLINGGLDLANIIKGQRTLVFDAAASADMISREVLVALNTDVGWAQTADGKYVLPAPTAGGQFSRIAIDMTDVALGWKEHAQTWIASEPAAQTYFEVGIILLGSDLLRPLPLTTIDNVRFLAADFNPDENGDLIAEGEVNGVDLGVWRQAFASTPRATRTTMATATATTSSFGSVK